MSTLNGLTKDLGRIGYGSDIAVGDYTIIPYKSSVFGTSLFKIKSPDKDGDEGKEELQMKLTFEIQPILKEYLKDGILIDNEDVKTIIFNLHV